jgi:hypothetical protein
MIFTKAEGDNPDPKQLVEDDETVESTADLNKGRAE